MNGFIKLFDKIGNDYILHFLCGFIITALIQPYSILLGVMMTVLLGLCKETYDEITIQSWDWKDFRYTCYGGIVAGVYYYLIYLI